MYLSRVFLDTRKRETMRLLSSPEYLHGAVERGFPPGRERRLWRLDGLEGQTCLLVLGEDEPDFTALADEYGFKDSKPAWESKAYQPMLDRLKDGQVWRFRLKANPVRSVSETEGRGKVMAHVTPQQQKDWLAQRASSHGFALNTETFEVVATQWLRFAKGHGHQVTLRTATFEGVLTVTDAALLKHALVTGIGRAKAYGCGLITLAPDGHNG